MRPGELRRTLEDWTRDNCGWEPERVYLGMSQLWRCPAELYEHLTNGPAGADRGGRLGIRQALRCYEGYMHEADLVARLKALGVYGPGVELVAEWDERLRGHTDGEIDGELLEIKSVPGGVFSGIRERSLPRRRDEAQVQMYLRFGSWPGAVILYKCRESGRVYPVNVMADEGTQRALEEKARAVLRGVDEGERPGCECGRCGA